jgi:hypothetical protein
MIHVVVGSLMSECLREQLFVEVYPDLDRDLFLATILKMDECEMDECDQ